MSDQFDALFTKVRGVQPPAVFAPAEQVRRRGRQRSHRQVLGAGAGVLAVAAVAGILGAGVTGSRPDGVSPPAASASPPAASSLAAASTPARTASPASPSLPLQPRDLGPGNWRRFQAEQIENADRWYWGFWNGMCPEYRSRDFPSLARQDALEMVAYRAPAPSGKGVTSVSQIVERYAAGGGGDNVTDVRAVIDRCGHPGPTPATPIVERFAVVDTGFAGDESLLVRQDQATLPSSPTGGTHVDYIAVVRVGDAVTTVRAYPSDPDRVRALAVRAADRLG
ncbi:hypothetical protein ACNAW0_24795 [Micromonospora sp. SL1-18]|uniref:hypothetical protein n=1 Tax=Micromonospora sp. SL1-18 TaxID=3399128 RepID=UPI003A4E60DD